MSSELNRARKVLFSNRHCKPSPSEMTDSFFELKFMDVILGVENGPLDATVTPLSCV